MEVGVVTVTYGDRINYVTKLIERVDDLGVKNICVVVNGSSKRKFLNLTKNNKSKFIFNDENLGSARGFKQGMEYLKSQPDIKYLWLLDDDNFPELDALDNLLKFITNNSFDNNKDALLSFRPDRKHFSKALQENNGSHMLNGKNSALGFSLFGKKQFTDYQKEGLRVAPYGGFFFHKLLIDQIGYPNETYFLYGDDYDFTIRVSENGGAIKLVKDSVVKDLELSFHLKEKQNLTIFNTRYHNTENLDRIFYSVRNGIRFELKHMVENIVIYHTNLLIYSLIIGLLLSLSLSFKKVAVFYKGLYLGVFSKN